MKSIHTEWVLVKSVDFLRGEAFEDELPHNSMQLPIRTTDG